MDEANLSPKHKLAYSFKFAEKLKDNELWKYFLSSEHRCIHKWLHYFEVYEKFFSPYKQRCENGEEIVFLEIGVQNAGSTQMWKHYFGKNVKIIGVDVEERCKQFEDDQITIEIGSQEDINFWDYFKEKYPKVDVLLDDGGHTMNQQIVTFKCMFPHVQNHGLYMAEDCHTSYMPKYGGSIGGGYTFIEFAKTFIDEINALHRDNDLQEDYNSWYMNGIHFYDAMVIIEKELRLLRPTTLKIGEAPVAGAKDTIVWQS